MKSDAEYLPNAFNHFATMCAGSSPLYASLSQRIAENPSVHMLASARQKGQPAVNLLFGAVHALLLAGVEHPLSEYYPSVGGERPPDDGTYQAFADFCHALADTITGIIATARVQTNEVGRCGLLLPAFVRAWNRLGRRPLHLVEVGCSAGLNLLLDTYRYEYRMGPEGDRVHTCGPDSSDVHLRTTLEAGEAHCPLPGRMPEIADRAGIDIVPVEVRDQNATRWIEALIWPDQMRRMRVFRAAVAAARRHPPRLLAGDALDLVPQVVNAAPPESVPCIWHSHATYQMKKDWRRRFEASVADLGRARDLAHISLEWLEDDPGPQLHLTVHADGDATTTHLADCHHHGATMRWLEQEPAVDAARPGGPAG